MNRSFRIGSASLVALIVSATAYAGPPHAGGLPPGLQKKLERGERLPPSWSARAAVYDYGQYGYEDSNHDQYEPEYVEDKVYRMIKDARDLIGIFPQ